MSPLKRLPSSIRYFIARLRPWTQPVVWAPCIVLGVGGLFIWEVSVHPEWLNSDEEDFELANNRDRNAGLSLEDQVIAAEIDTVPVLVKQLNRSNPSANFLNRSVIRTKGLFDEVREGGLETPNPNPVPKEKAPANPFLTTDSSLVATNGGGVETNLQPVKPTPANQPPTLAELIRRSQLLNLESGNPPEADAASLLNLPTPLNQTSSTASSLQAVMEQYLSATEQATSTSSAQTPSTQTAQTSTTGNSPSTGPTLLPPFGRIPEQATRAFVNPLTAQQPANSDPTNGGLGFQQPISPNASVNPYQTNVVPSNPGLPTQSAPPALPSNPYQTNGSGSGLTPPNPSGTLTLPGSPSPQVPTTVNPFGSSSFPSTSQGTKIESGYSPNEANAAYQYMQSNPSYVTPAPSYSTPTQINQSVNPTWQPVQPAPYTVPNSVPGRYIGGGEIDTFANP